MSAAIREGTVADAVSRVAAVPRVRERMVAQQRDLVGQAAQAGLGVVMEGRDIGTVVLPEADLKVFLIADAHERASRRAREEAGDAEAESTHLARTEANLRSRDALDSRRAVSPLQRASDAVLIDGTHLSLDAVVTAVIQALPADAQ